MATLVAVVVGSIIIGVQSSRKVVVAMNAGGDTNVLDSYMVFLPSLIRHHAPYTDDTFPLPPFAMLFVAPLTWLSRPTAQVVWAACKPLLFVPSFLLVLSMARQAGAEIRYPALIPIIIAVFFPVLGDVQEGQMNLVMLLPLTLALWSAQKTGPRSDLAAGLLLAMAICIKVTPLAFLPYFVWRRRWGIVAWTLGGIYLWLVLVPSIFFGWGQNLAWLTQWSNIMIRPYVFHSAIKFSNGESIPELIARLFSHAPAWTTHDGHGQAIQHYMNISGLSEGTVHSIGRIVLGAIGVAGVWWMRRPLTGFLSRRYVMEVSCVVAFMLWASERTWVHHYVSAIIPLMAVGIIASDPAATRVSRKWAWAALIGAAILIPFTSDLGRLFGHDGQRYVEGVDFVLFASLGLAAAIVFAERNGRQVVPGRDEMPIALGLISREPVVGMT
ncbi:MAG TPA: glycosyltransferase family 87 protein [Phycisphaerae bacterium]|nr:glycosyltransferase family 87 protein [Phycisphaerae bacterium]